jgi:tRNA 2-selenouridine synthase
MPLKTDINEFFKLSETFPVIDVRSPLEFKAGHFPGAINIPIFDDDERAIVGTVYKKEGRNPAILEGLKLTGPTMHKKLEQALNLATDGKLLVHCWRGGMRSEAMAWLFSLGGIETFVLEGGYKSYRHYILEQLTEKRKIIVLGGMTGSSKTHILNYIKEIGHQVIDLEGLACHKGSAFGSLGQPPQPSTEQFVNDLYARWRKLKPDAPVWLEDESRNIGTVFMPDSFYGNMQESSTVVLKMDIKTRLPRLMEEYSVFSPGSLRESIMKISKRLGGDNTRDAILAVDSGDIAKAIGISLIYYDKAYQYSLRKKDPKNMIFVETETDDLEINAMKVLAAAEKSGWTV